MVSLLKLLQQILLQVRVDTNKIIIIVSVKLLKKFQNYNKITQIVMPAIDLKMFKSCYNFNIC